MEKSEGYKVYEIYELNDREIEEIKVIFSEDTSYLYDFAVENPEYFEQEPIAVKNNEYDHGLIAATEFSEKGVKKIRAKENYNTPKSPLKLLHSHKIEILLTCGSLFFLFMTLYFIVD